jgi:hypothetical protein
LVLAQTWSEVHAIIDATRSPLKTSGRLGYGETITTRSESIPPKLRKMTTVLTDEISNPPPTNVTAACGEVITAKPSQPTSED